MRLYILPQITKNNRKSSPIAMDDQKSLEAQLLGDMGYEDPRKAAQPQVQYQELSAEQIAILQQQRAAKGQPPYTEEEIAEIKTSVITPVEAREASRKNPKP